MSLSKYPVGMSRTRQSLGDFTTDFHINDSSLTAQSIVTRRNDFSLIMNSLGIFLIPAISLVPVQIWRKCSILDSRYSLGFKFSLTAVLIDATPYRQYGYYRATLLPSIRRISRLIN